MVGHKVSHFILSFLLLISASFFLAGRENEKGNCGSTSRDAKIFYYNDLNHTFNQIKNINHMYVK